MSEHDLPEDDHIASGGGLQGWHLIVIALVALGIVGGGYWYSQRDNAPSIPTSGRVAEVPAGSRTVTLFFASDEEPVLFTESRQVAIGSVIEEQIAQVLRALLLGPEFAGVPTTAEGTRLLGLFYDEDSFTVYADFSEELVAGHPGGSSAEYFTVSAIMKTISENFPEVQALQILVEGSQVGTIAGHIDAHKPFLVKDWR